MESIAVFIHITEVANFWWKNADVRTQGLCDVIYIFFRSSFGKI